ncbi:MAG: o-succinylbenzoate--CoA ligase [Alphaproteobacteria bacterium]|nr:o-succinylbenzoate--CoA ligase [Alphaproteobacteria bacterium]
MRVIDFFDRGALIDQNRAFMIDGDRQQTYREAQVLSHRIARALLAAGYRRGESASVYSHNDISAFDCVLGIFRAGGVWVPLNARNAVPENCYILDNVDVQVLFYHSSFEDNVAVFREKCPKIRLCICLDKKGKAAPWLEDFIAGHEGEAPFFPDMPTDVCALFGSGGTTGFPKGVIWTNLVFETMAMGMLALMPPRKPPVHVLAAPMTHAAGGLMMVLMAIGATNVILPGVKFPDLMQAIEKHKATYLFLPPTAIYVMLAQPDVRKYDYSSMEHFLYAAAPMSVDKLRESMDVFGPVMCQLYGQAEAPFICTFFSQQEHVEALHNQGYEHRLYSCGRPALSVPLEILDDDGNILPRGEKGEICVRGNLVMPGYYKNPKATAEVHAPNGWHRTGDIGYQDDEGWVYIVDRKKDMIISGGFNIYPSEIEQVIWSHAAVQDCAVIGVPDEKWGESVKAVIELKPGMASTEDEIIALCKTELGSVKSPKTVEFWDQLPRSAVGKVRKKDIREKFWVGQARRV